MIIASFGALVKACLMLNSRTDVIVRSAKVSDATRLTAVFRESWRNAYMGIIPHHALENMMQERDSLWWRTQIRSGETILVVEVAGKVGGYATAGVSRTRGDGRGEIYELYLEPSFQGLGLGEHLFEACRFRLDGRKLKGLVVWALTQNTSAIEFYERRGGRPVGKTTQRFGRTRLEKIALAWG
jgi:ribosomal protein S18 acetylase RimI-like enzyme